MKDNDTRVVLGTVGEFRMVGINMSSMTDDLPEDAYVVLPIKNAINLATKIAAKWELTPSQQVDILKENDLQKITDILKIEMYLDVLFPNQRLKFIRNENHHFSDMRVVDYMFKHGTKEVVNYLAHHVFNGGW